MRSPKTQRLWLVGSIMAWLSVAAPLLAQPAAPLTVTRGEGASDCPDAAGLTARIEEIRKTPAPAAQPPYDVTFVRDEHGVYAEIASAQTGAERVLTDTSIDCTALAQATAVTLALLFDAEARALETAPPAPPPLQPKPEQPPPPVALEAHDPANVHRYVLRYGVGGLTGVTAPLGFGVAFGLEYAYGSWRASLSGLFAGGPPQELGSGDVAQSLAGASLVGCYAPWRHALWRFDVCPGLFLGRVRATAHDFAERGSAAHGWFAPMAEARLGLLPDSFGFEVSAAMLVPTTRQDFAIEGAGVAYESSPIAFLIALHLTWAFAQTSP